MKRSHLLVAIAAALLPVSIAAPLAAPAFAQQSPQPRALAGAERTQTLIAASAAVNKIAAAQGRFTQFAPSGARTTGVIYLQRPGKVRFAYDAPSPLTIVSDGATVFVEDREVRDTSSAPLRATPLFYVLKRNVSFEKDARITRVERVGDRTLITARDRTGEAEGEITIIFGPAYDLLEWAIVDAQGGRTRVVLTEFRKVATLDSRLFRLGKSADAAAKTAARP